MIDVILNEIKQLQDKELEGWQQIGREIIVHDLKRDLLEVVRKLMVH